ncbi:MAG: glycosyltransferase family 4 protein [Chloroflexi bacterium]|nr:glycosyltransferase family 4 protein [Chloroflexota bacterium]
MKILHIVHGYPPNIGGTQRLFQKVSEGLVHTFGDEVTVFTTNAYSNAHFWQADDRVMPTGWDELNGVQIYRFPVFNRFSWLRLNLARVAYKVQLPYHDWARAIYNGPLIRGLVTAVATHQADIITASAFPLLHMHHALQGSIRSHTPIIFHGGLHPADKWGFDRKMIFDDIQQADGYLANTQFEKTYLIKNGVSPHKISITGAGMDPTELQQADGAMWRHTQQLIDVPLIAFVGQQIEHKGIDTLLAAMPAVWTRLPQATVVIAGKPTAYSATLRAMVAALPPAQQSRVFILDEPREHVKNGLIAACDLLALPSRHESFGMVFVEAWACGKPVIGARIGATESLISPGKDGLLITPGAADELADAIVDLLANEKLRHQMGQAGQEKARTHYSWDAIVRKFRNVYSKVIAAQRN